MSASRNLLAAVAVLAAAVGCSTARDPARGFRLPVSGDVHRGRAAFLEFACNECHEVKGASLPIPAKEAVALGGSVIRVPSDGYLVTAIINPKYHSTLRPASAPLAGALHMPDFTARMTVQQLTDIVAYLHTRYSLAPAPVQAEFP